MRWNKVFDRTKESLLDKSHRPLTPHPNSHTPDEIKKIVDLMRRNPKIGFDELFSKLRLSIGYTRHPVSLYRWLLRQMVTTRLLKSSKSDNPSIRHFM
jgi:hypothetical protein